MSDPTSWPLGRPGRALAVAHARVSVSSRDARRPCAEWRPSPAPWQGRTELRSGEDHEGEGPLLTGDVGGDFALVIAAVMDGASD